MKKLFSLLLSLIMVSGLYAQNAKSAGITDSDVKNWAKNLNPIVSELQALGVWSNDSINASPKQKASVDGVLNKYGISGSNCIEKFGTISSCAVAVCAASEIDAQSAAMLKAMGMDPMAELKKNLNPKDYAVVEANSKAVVKAYNNLDSSSLDNAGSSAASEDYSYGDKDLADLYSRLGNAFSQAAAESEGDEEVPPEHAKTIKKLYEQVSRAKGDSGYIYKTKKSASKYKKTNYKKGTVLSLERYTLKWSFDLDRKKAKLDFAWGKDKKTINYTITSVEYYYVKDGSDMGGESKEYVVTTKEGPVFHFFDEWDFSGNEFKKQISIKGVDFKNVPDYEYSTWSDYSGD